MASRFSATSRRSAGRGVGVRVQPGLRGVGQLAAGQQLRVEAARRRSRRWRACARLHTCRAARRGTSRRTARSSCGSCDAAEADADRLDGPSWAGRRPRRPPAPRGRPWPRRWAGRRGPARRARGRSRCCRARARRRSRRRRPRRRRPAPVSSVQRISVSTARPVERRACRRAAPRRYAASSPPRCLARRYAVTSWSWASLPGSADAGQRRAAGATDVGGDRVAVLRGDVEARPSSAAGPAGSAAGWSRSRRAARRATSVDEVAGRHLGVAGHVPRGAEDQRAGQAVLRSRAGGPAPSRASARRGGSWRRPGRRR